jgi:hypothetical protein
MNDRPQITDEDLFWQAVRFAQGDLPGTEQAAFAERLSTDVAACEALADAVKLFAGLASALAPPATRIAPPSRRPQQQWVPVGISAALILLTGVLAAWWSSGAASDNELGPAELVSRWHSEDLSPFEEETWEEDWEHHPDAAEESLAAPNWLLTAVRLTGNTPPAPAGDPDLQEQDEET